MGRLQLLFRISIAVFLIGTRNDVCADKSIDDLAETLKLLEFGTKTISSLGTNKEIILVLGNYGSGTATLCSYVTGKLEELESLETSNNTGEFLIHANKSVRSGIETLLPELYLDENGAKWFTIPEFSSRNILTEIATTFFTKQLIDSAESIKLVFVVNHGSLQIGFDSTDFMELVSEASKLLKHIDHYKLSISLIATKVKEFKKIDGQYQPTPDDLIRSSIGSYLHNLVNEFRTTKDGDSTTDSRIGFLETLLQSSEGVYTRIGIARRPEQAGLLSEIPSMVQGRFSIRKVVLENTKYATIQSDDFGYTLSESYRGQVVDLAQQISQNVSGTVRKLANGIENHFRRMSSDAEDFTELLHEFSRAERVLSQLKNNVNLTVKELLTLITEIGDELEIAFDIDDLENIMNQQKYLELLEIVSVKKLPISSNDWIAEFNSCLNYVAEEKSWLLFVTEMDEHFSSYDVQSDVTRYNVVDLSDWGEVNKTQGIKVDYDNFDLFLEKQRNYLSAGAATYATASTYRLDMVNSVLRATVGDTVTKKCVGCTGYSRDVCTLTVQGRFVKTSDIDLDSDCNTDIRNLNVFALDTIFVDKDLILEGKEVTATLIAPKWDIAVRKIGSDFGIEIAVNGATGPNKLGKAQTGTTISPDGQPGKPGGPGYNGGRLLAISQHFKNHLQLKLSAEGGKGGRGQNGGDAVLDREGCGGRGGGGGAGGFPGNPGLLKIIPIDYEVKIYSYPWKKGDGAFGTHGKSVKHTNPKDYECTDNSYVLANFVGREEPKPQSKKVPVSGYIAYKHFVRENLANYPQKAEILHFVDRMESNADILSQYEIKDLIDDIQSLESHFLRLHQDVDFAPFYESYEAKVLNFTEMPDQQNLTESHKVVLNYLYSAAYSKLYSLKANDESILVINILEHLNLIKERINQVNQIGKEQVINNYKDEYKKDIDVKIDEANNLIKTEITPEFDNIYRKIDEKIADLVEDTIKLQKDKRTEVEKYKQQKKELERNIGLRVMLGAFKAIGQVVGFMGPYGAAAGSAINLGTSIGGGFVKDPDVKPEPFKMPDGISTALDDISGAIKYRKEQKSKAIDSEIKRLEEEIKKDPEVRRTLEETLTDITKLKEDIKKEKGAETPDQSKIDELEAKLPTLIKERQKQLKDKSEKPNKVVERSLTVLTVANNVLEVAETGIEIYNKFEEDREKIEQVGGLISQSENDLQSLISYEKKIYDTFIPMMRGMRDDMNNVEKNLESKSQVSLDVTKWKVQSHLKDLKSKMASFTKGYSVQEELGECIEKLTFALTTIINIFDRIQSYQDQQKLAIYIANINSPYIQNIKVHGEYRVSVTNLELLIQSNIIMQLFHNVVSSFKQHVFPFARQFLDSYEIPNVLKLTDDNDINVLKTNAIKQIDDMRTKMLKNLTTIQEIDKIVLDGEFDYEGHYLKPFYVWEYKERGEVIDRLLSGKEVFLRADIKAGINFNAIKFRTININFRAKDPAENVRLQDDLKKFGLILTHMGESYYKCDNNFYIITTESLPIEFSIARGSSSSRAYEKLKSGNILLSPYTSWKIKLIPGLQADPKKLEVYKGKIDLELVGSGQYVKSDVNVCNAHSLQRFYKLDKTTIHEPDRTDGKVLFEASPPSENGYLNLDEINYLL